MATIFHFTFNIFLSAFENRLTGLVYSTSLLMVMAFLVSILFDKIKERHTRATAGLATERERGSTEASSPNVATVVSNKVINLLG